MLPLPREDSNLAGAVESNSGSSVLLWIGLGTLAGACGLASLYSLLKEDVLVEESETNEQQNTTTTAVDKDAEDTQESDEDRDLPRSPREDHHSERERSRYEEWTHRRLPTTYEGSAASGVHRKSESRYTHLVEERTKEQKMYRVDEYGNRIGPAGDTSDQSGK